MTTTESPQVLKLIDGVDDALARLLHAHTPLLLW